MLTYGKRKVVDHNGYVCYLLFNKFRKMVMKKLDN